MKATAVRLQSVSAVDLEELRSWFQDLEAAQRWGGPAMPFPLSRESFRDDVRCDELPSFSLFEGEEERMVGFGQYYERAGRCHLARLAVAPGLRGRGLGAALVTGLCRLGCRELTLAECSLFVMPQNRPARGLYEKLGFRKAEYPEGPVSLPGALYMTATLAAVEGARPPGLEIRLPGA